MVSRVVLCLVLTLAAGAAAQTDFELQNGVMSPARVLNETMQWQYYKYTPSANNVTVKITVAASFGFNEQIYVKVGARVDVPNSVYDYVHERGHAIYVHPCAGLVGDIYIAVTYWSCSGTCTEETDLKVRAIEQTPVPPQNVTTGTNFTLAGNDGLTLVRVNLPSNFNRQTQELEVSGPIDNLSWDAYVSQSETCPTYKSQKLFSAPAQSKFRIVVSASTTAIVLGIRMWVAEDIFPMMISVVTTPTTTAAPTTQPATTTAAVAASSAPTTTPAPANPATTAAPTFTHEVSMKVNMPYSLAQFNANLAKITAAFAAAASVPASQVSMTATEIPGRRLLLAASVDVTVKVKTQSQAAASTISSALTTTTINTALSAQGVESATIVEEPAIAVLDELGVTTPGDTTPAPGMGAGAVLTSSVAVSLLACVSSTVLATVL